MHPKTTLKTIAIDKIDAPLTQIRRTIDQEPIRELAASIHTLGIINPITVAPIEENRYRIVAGLRRYLAAQLLGLIEIPCTVRTDQTQQEFLTVHENLYRENLNPIEEADQIHAYILAEAPTLEHLAAAWGKSASWIQSRIEIASYPQELRDAIEQKQITLGAAQKIMTVSEDWQRKYFITQAIENASTIREINGWIATYRGMEDPLPDSVITREQIAERQKELATYTDCRICTNRTGMTELYTLLVCPNCADSLKKAVEEGRPQQGHKPQEN